ncbi:unnamed protein product [Rhizophagus irregularis]|nr:unnamed protein product [Rhizophagus irregularis]
MEEGNFAKRNQDSFEWSSEERKTINCGFRIGWISEDHKKEKLRFRVGLQSSDKAEPRFVSGGFLKSEKRRSRFVSTNLNGTDW